MLEAVDAVRDAAKRVRVVATLRSTSQAMDAVASATKIFNRFKTIVLEDWTDVQRDPLIARTGVSLSYWDGTPLSAKQPSDEMEHIYWSLPESQKQILACAKICETYGLHYCSRPFMLAVATRAWPTSLEAGFTAAMEAIRYAGFLKGVDDAIWVYAPYLSFVDPIDRNRIWNALREALIDCRFSRELFVVGRAVYLQQEYSVAQELFEQYAQREPNVEAGHYRLALTFMRLGKLDDAIARFRRAIEIQPQFSSALFQLANAYNRSGRNDLAKATFLRARATQTDISPAGLLAHAELMLASNETQEALELVTLCLDRDPDNRHGWGIKGQALLRLGKDASAEDAFKEAIAREPDAFVHFGMGLIARRRKDWFCAAEHFRTATDLLPNFAQAYSQLGQSLQKLGHGDDAIAAFEHAVQLGEGAAPFGLGLAFTIKGDWPSAARHFEMAVANDQSFGVAYSYLGTALEKLGKFNEALEAHEMSICIDPMSKHFRFTYAEGLAKVDRTQDAIAAYEASLEIDPKFAPAVRRLREMRARNSPADTRR